ncbi:MAG TPA: AAA family ATPase [Bdellovibrionales bacterium]|nr:AAA family ATPase [Bdellovibrionales bacterium]
MSVTLKVDDSEIKVSRGTTLSEVIKLIANPAQKAVFAAYVDNKMRELSTTVEQDSEVRLVGLEHLDGIRIYQRSASFILIKAVHDLAPDARIKILHPIANGLYVEISGFEISPQFVKAVEHRMQEIVALDLPFTREEVPIAEAIETFRSSGREDKARLLSYRNAPKASIYKLDGQLNYFYGYLAPTTSYIKTFSLTPHDHGMILHLPSISNPNKLVRAKKNKKLYDVFKETLKWRQILDVEDVGMLNSLIRSERYTEFVLLAEAFHEKKIAQIADTIFKRKQTKVILLSGPSASGKTTFVKRLAMQLRINGLKPLLISMDDYFLDRDKTSKSANGDHDFESPHAMNIELFLKNLKAIVASEETELPRYDFKTGTSGMSGKTIKPSEDNVVIVEGIHGLNPLFSSSLPKGSVFKIYVSPLTEIPLDSHNRIPTTDIRILRRMLRDHQFRSYSAAQTILRWPSVREGETRHVFPFQEEADVFFNTALFYEFAALKPGVEPLLDAVPHESPAYGEAVRLKKFLSYFLPIPMDVVPRHSLLREFLGGSSFEY